MTAPANLARCVLDAPGFAAARAGLLGQDALPSSVIADRAHDLADELRAAGLAPDEPVVLYISNVPDDLVGFLGIWLARGVAAPIHVATPRAASDALIARLGARLAVRAAALERCGEAPPPSRRQLEGAALIVFTSGSTGQPKGVVITHDGLTWKLDVLARLIPMTPGDVVAVPLQLTFIFGIWVSLLGLMSGAHVALAPRFSTTALRANPDVSVLAAVPTLLRTLCAEASLDAPRLRYILTGGEPFSAALGERLSSLLPDAGVFDLYGLTETGSCDFGVRPQDRPAAQGTIGRPTEGVAFRIAGMPELGLAAGVGELQIRTPAVMAGYLDDAALTRAAFADGYFRTGDLAIERDDGLVQLVGRAKDVISRGGNKIAPLEIENLFARHHGVAAALAFGMPDERLGESLHLMVVAREPGLSEVDLRAWASDRLERFKTPDVFHFVEALPAGRTGKADRAAARAHLAGRSS